MQINKITIRTLNNIGSLASIFGIAMVEQAAKHPEMMMLTADQSVRAGLKKYITMYPNQYLNVGIQEQNMIGMAAGLVSEGHKVAVDAQSCFLSMRSFEQIRQYVGYMKFPMVLIGISSGFTDSFMGNTHYSLEDIGLMRNIPGMHIICPCDALEAYKAFNEAFEKQLPTYIRIAGATLGQKPVYTEDFDFQIGKASIIKEGLDVQIIATGSMVQQAIIASNHLEEKGISAAVVDMHTVKPLDIDAVNLKAKLIVTVEEHNTETGLGSAVSNYLASIECHPRLIKCGLQDHYSIVGEYDFLLDANGISGKEISNNIINNL